MNELQTSLFEAMEAFSKNVQQNSNTTLTIEATIVEFVNEGLGEYKVDYLGQKFSAYNNNPNLVYSVGNTVFILVPDGNFSKKKIILGLSKEQATYTTTTETDEGVTYYELSDNLFDIEQWNDKAFDGDDYGYPYVWDNILHMNSHMNADMTESQYHFNAGVDGDYISDNLSVFHNPKTFAKNLNNYLKYSKTFKLSFLVKTNLLQERQNSGIYGATFSGVEKGVQLDPTYSIDLYKLDSNNMLGNPYRYTEWTPQTLYITFDDDFEFNEENIGIGLIFYCYNFPTASYGDNYGDEWDILIKDISLKSVVAVEADNNGYILTLKATEGNIFNQNFKTKKTITPTLKANGKTINFMNDETTEVYWFRQNSLIGIQSEKYCRYGGPCWECLNETTNVVVNPDGTSSFDWIKNVSTLEVLKTDVPDTMIYKCVIVYKGKQITSTIELKTADSNTFFELTTSTGSTQYIANTGKVQFIIDLYMDQITNTTANRNNINYFWSRFDKKGNYINNETFTMYGFTDNFEVITYNEPVKKKLRNIDLDCYETIVEFPVSLIDKLNTFYCSGQYTLPNGKTMLLGTSSIVISTTNLSGYRLNIENEEVLYKYDTNGDSPMGDAYDGPTTSKVTSILPLTFKLFKPDGVELTDAEYSALHYTWTIPKKSLFIIEQPQTEEKEEITPGEIIEVTTPNAIDTTPVYSEDDDNYYVSGIDGHNIGLTYKIRSIYNKVYALNGITLKVEFNGNVIEKRVAINFLKDGDSGTNGTSYAAILVSGADELEDCVPYCDEKKLVYYIQGNNLYYYDYEDYEWVSLDDYYKPYPIYPKVYKDGELLTCYNDYEVEYSMFDSSSSSGTAKPLLALEEDKISPEMDNGGICIVDTAEGVDLAPDHCTILQAKITVKAGNDSAVNAPQIIYAYYPIDIFVSSIPMPSQFLPYIKGGFSEVMYEADGTNPSYDETKEFEFGISEALISFSPSSSEPLPSQQDTNESCYIMVLKGVGEQDAYIQTQDNKLSIGPHLILTQREQKEDGTILTAFLKPDMKYDDGYGGTYLSAFICQNNIKYTGISALQNRLNELRTQGELLEYNYSRISNSYEELENFGRNFYLNNYISQLEDDVGYFLNLKTECKNSAQEILNYIQKLANYIHLQSKYNGSSIESVCSSTISELVNLNEQTDDAIVALNTLDNSEGHTTNDLIDLSSYKITWDSSIQDYYADELGYTCMVALGAMVEDINTTVDTYTGYKQSIENGGWSSYIDTYNSIITSMQNACNRIRVNNYFPEIIDLKNKTLLYINNFKNYSSTTELASAINRLYENVLKSVFNNAASGFISNGLTINDATKKYIEKVQKDIQNELNLVLAEYQEISYAIEHWQENPESQVLSNVGVYIRSIPLYFNRYGMSNINGWDGNKIDTGDGSYLLAPQVGAGLKEEDNSFTGLVMGLRNVIEDRNSNTIRNEVGLFGYARGHQSLFLNARNGAAIFGLANSGQIIIDPRNSSDDPNKFYGGMIYSSNFWKTYSPDGLPQSYDNTNKAHQGMLINFTKGIIEYGSGFFTVDENGNIHAGGGGEGSVGGWNIHNTYIASANFQEETNGIKLDAENSIIAFGSNLGSIYSGKHNTVDSLEPGFYLSNKGISIGNVFKVDENGTLRIGEDISQEEFYFEVNSTTNKVQDIDGSSIINVSYFACGHKQLGAYMRAVRDLLTDDPPLPNVPSSYYYPTGPHGPRIWKMWGFLHGIKLVTDQWQIGGHLHNYIASLIPAKGSPGQYTIEYGFIADPGIDLGDLKTNEVYIGTDGIRMGRYFAVNSTGSLKATGSTFNYCTVNYSYLQYALLKYARLEGDEDNPIEIKYASLEGGLNSPIVLKYSHLVNTTIDNAVIDNVNITDADMDHVDINNATIMHGYLAGTLDNPFDMNYVDICHLILYDAIPAAAETIPFVQVGLGVPGAIDPDTGESTGPSIDPDHLVDVISWKYNPAARSRSYLVLGNLNELVNTDVVAWCDMWTRLAFYSGECEWNWQNIRAGTPEAVGKPWRFCFWGFSITEPYVSEGANVRDINGNDISNTISKHLNYDNIYCYNSTATGGGYANVYCATNPGPSDIRYKNIHSEWMSLDISKKIITSLEPIAFTYTDGTEGNHRGFSAQQVKEIMDGIDLPEMIYKYNKHDDRYFLSQQELIPDLVNCIQDLYKQIEELKEKLNEHTN